MSDTQARMLTDTRQLADAEAHARDVRNRFRGSMTWKTSNGAKYLIKIIDSHGGQRSLGPLSDATQATYDAFVSGKTAATQRLKTIGERLDQQARFNKAARLGRVPTAAAGILRKLDHENLLGRGIMVIGTNALYAYESEAAVTVDRDQTATDDIDLLWDVRQRLQLAGDAATAGLIGLLKSVDATFEKILPYRAANESGYFVDFTGPQSTPIDIDDGRHSIGGVDDLQAVEIEGLWWLKNVPSLSAVAVGEDGYPVRIAAPHPVAFAAHKRWLSERRDRDPAKRGRDRAQSALVTALVADYLPMWRYDERLLQALPKHLRAFVDPSANGAAPPS